MRHCLFSHYSMCKDSDSGRVPFHPNMRNDQVKQLQGGNKNDQAKSIEGQNKRNYMGKSAGQARKPKLSKVDLQNNNCGSPTQKNSQRSYNQNMNMRQGSENKRPGSSPVQQAVPVDSNRTSASSPREVKPITLTPSKRVTSPIVSRSPSKSPTPANAYAGPKFSDPPSPKVLPKPPTHWFSGSEGAIAPVGSCSEMSCVLKMMLNVQA